jgi:hypothetical protein
MVLIASKPLCGVSKHVVEKVIFNLVAKTMEKHVLHALGSCILVTNNAL